MGIFSDYKKEGELALVFDISSSSVGGALFLCNPSGVPKIVLTIREAITLEEVTDPARLLSLTIKALEIVASRVCLSGYGAPTRIFCVLSSPWYASQTRVIKLEKNTPFTFSAKLADDLIKREIGFFQEEHLSKHAKTSNKVRPFELKSMQTTMNGYVTSDPLGKRARQLEMTIFVSMSAEQVLQKIEDVIARHFHRTDVKYSSFVMAAFSAARDMNLKEQDFLLVDIGGEVTDISMIKHGKIRESVSFPHGHNFMVRKIATALHCTLSEAKSYLSLYKDRHAAGALERKLTPIIQKLEMEWLDNLQHSLVDLSNDISIPSAVFVTAPEDMTQFFSEIIKAEQFSQYSLTDSKFQVNVLDTKSLHSMAVFEDDIIRDPFLIIESMYINRFLC